MSIIFDLARALTYATKVLLSTSSVIFANLFLIIISTCLVVSKISVAM